MNKNKLIKHIERTVKTMETQTDNKKRDELVAAIGGKVALKQLLSLIKSGEFDEK